MSTKWIKPTAPLSSVRSIEVDDLPASLIDIEMSTPPPDPVKDTAVLLLRPEHGPPAAVVKVAHGVPGAAELRRQRRVLAELAIHRGLDERWRELVPRILAFNERADTTVSVESYRPGMDLREVLARRPDRFEELTTAALSAIAPLHRRTASFVGVDNICLLRRLMVEPLARLTDMCRRLDRHLVPGVDRLGAVLRQALVGRRIPVGWTHGDYTPGNVRVAGVQGPVTGIVDWGRARPRRPALLDEYLMVLTASCEVEQADIGAVVTERLRKGGLSDRERESLRAARDPSDPNPGGSARIDGHLDERVAILLTWVQLVADSWRTRATHPNQHLWWATNVAPVLDAVAAQHGFGVPARGGGGAANGASVTTSPLGQFAAHAAGNHEQPDEPRTQVC